MELNSKTKEFVVPLGVTINNLKIGCTPGRHYSVRVPTKNFASLWASWVFVDKYNKVFISNHGWDDLVIRFVQKAKEENLTYTVLKIGETFDYKKDIKTEEWWTSIE